MTSNTGCISITFMTSITTVTQKGQVTLPIRLREEFDLKPYDRVRIEKGRGFIKVHPVEDILDLARKWKLKTPKGKNALKAREWMEKHYKRT